MQMQPQQPCPLGGRQHALSDDIDLSTPTFAAHILDLRRQLKHERCAGWTHKIDRERPLRGRGKALSVPGRIHFRSGVSRRLGSRVPSCPVIAEEAMLGGAHASSLPQAAVRSTPEDHSLHEQLDSQDSYESTKSLPQESMSTISGLAPQSLNNSDNGMALVRRQSCPAVGPYPDVLESPGNFAKTFGFASCKKKINRLRFSERNRAEESHHHIIRHAISDWSNLEAKMEMEAWRRHMSEDRRLIAQYRDRIRDSLMKKAGSSQKAFRLLDQSGSGVVSLSEFEAGIQASGVKWEELTGFTTISQLFRIFDQAELVEDRSSYKGPKGYLTFLDLFPVSAKRVHDPMRMSSPDFWEYWCDCNEDLTPNMVRNARWETNGPEKLKKMHKARVSHETVEAKKKWMRGAIHGLKSIGKSDGQCREIIAHHLPRGSGPKDVVGVPAFSEDEVRACKKEYAKQAQASMKTTAEFVSEMQSLRKDLLNTRHHLEQTCKS